MHTPTKSTPPTLRRWLAHAGTVCAALSLAFTPASQAQAQTPPAYTVFACEPEWGALARVLMPSATIHVATHAGQDPHHIEARPALIAQLRSADLAVCTGASLESGWLPTLQERSGNARARNVFFAAQQVSLIDPQPGAIGTPWAGDQHAEGNPHVQLDPHRLLQITQALAKRISTDLPQEANAIEQRRQTFETQWRQKIAEWEQRASVLRNQPVVVQHTSFAYLWAWLHMRAIADLEPKPGMAPTPGHLQRLLEGLHTQSPMAVIITKYQDTKPGRWISDQLGADKVPVLILPSTVPNNAQTAELVQWMDGVVNELVRVARGSSNASSASGRS